MIQSGEASIRTDPSMIGQLAQGPAGRLGGPSRLGAEYGGWDLIAAGPAPGRGGCL